MAVGTEGGGGDETQLVALQRMPDPGQGTVACRSEQDFTLRR